MNFSSTKDQYKFQIDQIFKMENKKFLEIEERGEFVWFSQFLEALSNMNGALESEKKIDKFNYIKLNNFWQNISEGK